MLLSFFFLAFYDFEIKNDRFDYLGNTIYTNIRSPLVFKSQLDSWYFIQFSTSNKVNCREKLTKENGLFLDTDSQITSHICLAFLSSENVSSLQSFYEEKHERIIIQQLEGHQKLHTNNFNAQENSNNEYYYIARFHKSFIPPIELNGKLTKLSDEIYLYQIKDQQKNCLNEILSIPSLRSISPQPPTKLMNRWNTGFIQKNEWPGGHDIYEKYFSASEIFSKGDLRVSQYFNDRGIDGTGQIITIADSGLDINSTYFADNSDKPFEYEKVDMSRRKVVYYSCFGNDHDSIDMHGTHIAGIVAGNAKKGESTDFEHQKFSLYNGVAPGAKISILDITEKDKTGTEVLNLPSILLGEAMGKAKSKIALCGWGNPSNIEQSYYYDMLAEFNPSRLFIFPAGNKGPGFKTVTTPGDGKNVLTVGALDSIWTSQYETKREYVLTNSSSLEEEHFLHLTNYGRDLFYLPTESGKFMIENAKVVSSLSSDVENKIVFITSSPNFCSLLDQAKSIAAAVFVGDTYDESLCPSETKFNFPVFLSNDTEILSYETVSIKVSLPDNEQETTILSVAQYSSRGPNFVGIQKPDVVAPGTSIYSSDSNFVSASSGTSNAAAYVAGVSALAYEYFERGFYPTGSEKSENSFLPTSDLVRAVIIASAEPLSSSNEKQLKEETGRIRGDRAPNSLSGHGVVNLASFVSFKPNMKVFNKIKVGDFQHFLMKFKITADQLKNNEKLDLRIAFAYKDPSSTNNYLSLQSNIDMYIILPNGTIVFGNHRPEENEERFSTVQRILIYNEELLQMASTTKEDVFELHFVTGGGFSNHQQSGFLSLVISGPFVNEDTSSEEATTLHDSSTFPLIEIENDPIKFFKFYASIRKECEFPQYGVLCQHNVTEIDLNETVFNLYSSTAKLVYINLPMNYTKIVFHLKREPTFTGRVAIQFAIDKADEYGSGYPFIVSLNGASSAVALSRSMFGANKFVGMRISNMVGIDLNVTTWITYETDIPQQTPTCSPAATIPRDVILHFSLSYGLFGLFLIPNIVFFVLICVVTNKIKKNREIRKASRSTTSTDNINNDINNELLKSDPL